MGREPKGELVVSNRRIMKGEPIVDLVRIWGSAFGPRSRWRGTQWPAASRRRYPSIAAPVAGPLVLLVGREPRAKAGNAKRTGSRKLGRAAIVPKPRSSSESGRLRP